MSIQRLVIVSVLVALSGPGAGAEDGLVGRRVRIELTPDSGPPDMRVCDAAGGGAATRIPDRGPGSVSCRRFEGKVVEEAADGSLVVLTSGRRTPVTIPEAALARVEVRERKSRAPAVLAGAAIGMVVGIAAGAAVESAYGSHSGHSGSSDCPPSFSPCLDLEMRGLAPAGLGILGTALGALVGAASPNEHWKLVRGGPKAVRFSIAPVPGRGAAASVTVAF